MVTTFMRRSPLPPGRPGCFLHGLPPRAVSALWLNCPTPLNSPLSSPLSDLVFLFRSLPSMTHDHTPPMTSPLFHTSTQCCASSYKAMIHALILVFLPHPRVVSAVRGASSLGSSLLVHPESFACQRARREQCDSAPPRFLCWLVGWHPLAFFIITSSLLPTHICYPLRFFIPLFLRFALLLC